MWEGQALPHDTKFGNCRCKIVDSRAFPSWSLIHGLRWSGLIKAEPGWRHYTRHSVGESAAIVEPFAFWFFVSANIENGAGSFIGQEPVYPTLISWLLMTLATRKLFTHPLRNTLTPEKKITDILQAFMLYIKLIIQDSSLALAVRLLSGECHRTSLMRSQSIGSGNGLVPSESISNCIARTIYSLFVTVSNDNPASNCTMLITSTWHHVLWYLCWPVFGAKCG